MGADTRLLEEHVAATSLNFAAVPAPLRRMAKNYVWQLLNCPAPPALRRFTRTRLAVRSVVSMFPSLTAFLIWLDVRDICALADIRHADLDAYLSDLRESGPSRGTLGERIITVRRLWAWRNVLPTGDRLPESPPWQGADADEPIGRKPRGGENRTPRIPSATIGRLLLWSLRFVHEFADDILAVRDEYAALRPAQFHRPASARRSPGPAHPRHVPCRSGVAAAAHGLRVRGPPGQARPDGQPVLDRRHLARMLNCPTHWLKRNANKAALATCGLPIADAAYLSAPIRGRFDGRPWRPHPITFAEAPHLIRHLSTACAVIVTYLSGGQTRGSARPASRLHPSRRHHWPLADAGPQMEGRHRRARHQEPRGRGTH
ncbi:site-specific integrase [Streptomyces sp. NPDC020965]|uniref:site-specific integrase n=1 Tax=Streptomyces sp. NPDC020965 TaxID=3365105 RepID=UPI0037BC0301